MAEYISKNAFLTDDEMTVNAKYIYGYLTSRGWTPQAVCGMLGNMETESTINPGIWQNLDEGNNSNGFGLVQWTPASTYRTWCGNNGLDPSAMDSALQRIEYELANGLQYYPTDAYPLTFKEFKVSTKSPSYLAQAFLKNYERPADQDQPARSTQAEKWYARLTGSSGSEGGDSGSEGEDTPIVNPSTVKNKQMSLLMIISATRKR